MGADLNVAFAGAPDRVASLTPLIAPRSVAIVGASSNPARIGGRPIAAMLEQGFEGRIMPVNPNRDTLQGLACFADIAALPEVPDVAIVAVPPDAAVEAVGQLSAIGTRAAVVFTAGFSEAGNGAAQATLLRNAAQMRVLGPNALGVFNAGLGYYAFFSSCFEAGYPLPGRIAIASQSGAYASHLYAVARRRGMATPLCITTGNEADVSVGDAIGWLARDPGTDVIAVYAESIRDAAAFVDGLACARANRKPVVMVKTGQSVLGARAALSHTASMAGDDAVFDAVLAEFGVARVGNSEELLDIAQAATRRIYPVNNTLGVLTISGGAGIQISDDAEREGLPMPPLPEAAQKALTDLIPFASPVNPVDCTAQIVNDVDMVGRFYEVLMTDGDYASALTFISQVGGARAMGPKIRTALAAVAAKFPDRLQAVSLVGDADSVAAFEADGLLAYEEPARAVRALAAMGRFGASFNERAPDPLPDVPTLTLPRGEMNEAGAKHLLAGAGIASALEQACADIDAAILAADRIGYPVVLKILSPDIAHKTEIGGVAVNIASAADLRDTAETMLRRVAVECPKARIEGLLVARQLSGGVECLMGVHNDPCFGPVAVFGLGGIHTEVFRDVVMRRCPFGPRTARDMILNIRAAALLQGHRGQPAADIDALSGMLSRLSVVAARHADDISAIDLNPVIVLPTGQGAFALDAVIERMDAP